ncbi:MAG: hypothetical protein FIB06_00130 [Betaproteobacteria bacterium]|nr:hypothetical protein [Betaproteobacteria bacterium]
MGANKMKTLVILALSGLCLLGGPAWADPFAVDQAGQQRMLTQRMVKSYAQIGLDLVAADAGAQLAGAVERFEFNLSWLGRIATSSPARKELADLRAAWIPLKKATLAEVSPQGLRELDARAATALGVADRLTRQLESESRVAGTAVINQAARQRMLSQRMVKVYMLRLSGFDSAELREEMKLAKEQFSASLDELTHRPGNSPAVVDKLHDLRLQWDWLQAALDTDGAENFGLVIAESGEAVLVLCEDIVRLYLYELTGRR